MEWLEDLTAAAEKIGCMDMLKAAQERIRNLENRRQTGVFITGEANSGKTTILNGIVGMQLREPGLLSEEEKPLRVVFEKQEDDEAFECRLAANRFWNNEDAILYEVKNTDIFQEDGRPGRLLDAADVVFYVVSAMTPFSGEDRRVVKALSFLPVKVVLNKIDLLDEDSQKKAEEYVTAMCAESGVGAPIIIRKAQWESIAKQFREQLPLWEEREASRRGYEEIIRRETAFDLLREAERQLADVCLLHKRKKEEQLEMSIEAQEKEALWGKLRSRMLEQGADLSMEVSRNVKGMAAKLSEKMGKIDFRRSREPERLLQKQMKKELERLAVRQNTYVEGRLKADSRSMMESAVNLGLTDGFAFSEAEFSKLTRIQTERMTSVMDGKECGSSGTGTDDKGNHILAGTAITIGLFAALPLPATISWVGGLATAGIGGSAYVRNTMDARAQEWRKLVRESCKVNLYRLADVLSAAVKEYYGQLADFIREKANAAPEPALDEEQFHREKRELREAAEQCRRHVTQ